MRLRLLPALLKVDTRGVVIEEKNPEERLDVRVMVDGVLTESSGGKTNSVCEGVGTMAIEDVRDERDDRLLVGVDGMRRGVGACLVCLLLEDTVGFSCSCIWTFTGDGGTGGKSTGGLRFWYFFGGADSANDCLEAGAVGGGKLPNEVFV